MFNDDSTFRAQQLRKDHPLSKRKEGRKEVVKTEERRNERDASERERALVTSVLHHNRVFV